MFLLEGEDTKIIVPHSFREFYQPLLYHKAKVFWVCIDMGECENINSKSHRFLLFSIASDTVGNTKYCVGELAL